MAGESRYPSEVRERAARIRLVVFDVDGVLTDGSLLYDEAGRELKAFHARDGFGMKVLQGCGIEIGIISGRDCPAVEARISSLGIEHLYQGRREKLPILEQLLEKLGIGFEETAYVGDDILDLPLMTRVGLSVAVADAHPEVSARAHWRTPSRGGRGAAREVCDLILEAHDKLDGLLQRYLE